MVSHPIISPTCELSQEHQTLRTSPSVRTLLTITNKASNSLVSLSQETIKLLTSPRSNWTSSNNCRPNTTPHTRGGSTLAQRQYYHSPRALLAQVFWIGKRRCCWRYRWNSHSRNCCSTVGTLSSISPRKLGMVTGTTVARDCHFL
jgi:hypothetical protein